MSEMLRTKARPELGRWRGAVALAALACAMPWAAAQHAADPAVGIYTCLDDKGRKLTADRPIP